LRDRAGSVDMHIHTTCSDGAFSPKEAVEYARKVNLAAVSITDHDSVAGIDEALQAASKTGLEVVPGIELSSEIVLESEKIEVHILGYFIDYKSRELQDVLEVFKKARYQRALGMLDKLKENGIGLKDESFVGSAGSKSIGRLHFAKALVEEKFAGSVREAFDRYLTRGRPAYVSKYSISAQEAVKLIVSFGGVPVIAHPYHIRSAENIVSMLLQYGLMGIEAWYIRHSESTVQKFLNLAEKFNLIVTGGSDCHGPYKNEPPVMGRIKVPYSVVENLKKCKDRIAD